MNRNFIFYLLVGLLCWSACGGDDSITDPVPEPEKPIFPDLSKVKIDEVYRNGLLYLRLTYNNVLLPDSMIYTRINGEIGKVHIRIKLEYDEESRLVSFKRLPGDCCSELEYEVEYVDDNLINIKEFRPGEAGYVIKSYQFDKGNLMLITENSFDADGNEYLQRQNTYLYQDGAINQVIYHRNYGVRTYDAVFDDKINPFYGIPTYLIGDVFPSLEYVPSNLLSLEGEYGTAILNEFTYDEDGYPISVDVTTDHLDMVITYIE